MPSEFHSSSAFSLNPWILICFIINIYEYEQKLKGEVRATMSCQKGNQGLESSSIYGSFKIKVTKQIKVPLLSQQRSFLLHLMTS